MGVDGAFTRPGQLGNDATLEGFRSGLALVDSWAQNHASSAKRRGTAVVYVSYTAGRSTPAGFHTLSSHSIERASVASGWLRSNAPCQMPAVLLGMLGVDARFQGKELGAALLADAVARSLNIADTIGSKALVVDQANDSARDFYTKHGFSTIPGTNRLFLPLRLS